MDSNEVLRQYGNKVRVRACGILIKDNSILLVKHKNLGTKGVFWSPPGGGVEFGQSIRDSLQREFKEETGLIIEICDFLFVSEFLDKPLHAIEFFFLVRERGGELKKGNDPEFDADSQIIEEVKMMGFEEINEMHSGALHRIFRTCNNVHELLNLRGFPDF